jgi:hypothetical protein
MACRQLVILLDTAGCFKLAIRITREYRPTEAHHKAQKKWRDNKNRKRIR